MSIILPALARVKVNQIKWEIVKSEFFLDPIAIEILPSRPVCKVRAYRRNLTRMSA
jgi:hypothetical protein